MTITTECARFRIGRDGRITRLPKRSPVPRGVAAWYPGEGAWYKLEDEHLVIGRWHERLWRSQGRFAPAFEVGAEIVGRFDEAFELGRQLLAPLRAGWLEALRTDVGVERKLAL